VAWALGSDGGEVWEGDKLRPRMAQVGREKESIGKVAEEGRRVGRILVDPLEVLALHRHRHVRVQQRGVTAVVARPKPVGFARPARLRAQADHRAVVEDLEALEVLVVEDIGGLVKWQARNFGLEEPSDAADLRKRARGIIWAMSGRPVEGKVGGR
jgi:hypothetical protein